MTNSICIILPGWITKHTGGAELQMYLLSERFVNSGWTVSVITVKRKLTIIESKINPKISYYYLKKFKLKTLGVIYVLYFLLRMNSDNYYLRTNALVYRIALKILKLIKKNKNVIYAVSSDTDVKIQSIIASQNRNPLLRIDSRICHLLDRNSLKAFDKIVAQTDYQKEMLYETQKLNSIVIPNSIDLPENNLRKENIFLWVGNMRTQKRPEILHRLIHDIDLQDWKLIIIGNNKEYKLKYFNQVPSNVTLLGEIPFDQVNEMFMRAKVLINTSNLEGFSNTFLQAWFYNVLLISLKVDPDNLIQKNNFGLVCDDNYYLLKKAVCRIIVNGTSSFSRNTTIAKDYVSSAHNLHKNFQLLNEVLK